MSKIKMRIAVIAACAGTFALVHALPVIAGTAQKTATTSTGTKSTPKTAKQK